MPLFKRTCPFLLTCWLLLLINICNGQNADINLLKAINPQNPHSTFWQTTSDSYVLVAAAAAGGSLANALIRNNRESRIKSLEIVGGLGITVVATHLLKGITDRTRPYDRYPGDVFVNDISSGSSMPSGHTSLAFATATSLTLAYPKWYVTVPAYTYAALMGYSRLYLGKHYPTDVLGGAVVGAGSSLLSHWLTRKIFKPSPTLVATLPTY